MPLFSRDSPAPQAGEGVSVYRWLLRLVNDEALAEDLLSDAFLDVWRHAASFEARASVSTWLLAIARYKALSARRRRTDAALDDQIASTVADPADGPDLVLEKKSTTELMGGCLTELSSVLDAMESVFENKLSRAATMLANGADELRAQLGKARGSIARGRAAGIDGSSPPLPTKGGLAGGGERSDLLRVIE